MLSYDTFVQKKKKEAIYIELDGASRCSCNEESVSQLETDIFGPFWHHVRESSSPLLRYFVGVNVTPSVRPFNVAQLCVHILLDSEVSKRYSRVVIDVCMII